MNTAIPTGAERNALIVRRYSTPQGAFKPERHWFKGESAPTHLLNTYTLLVPDNEGFYIRTLSSALPLLGDERLKASVREFCRQEGQHGVAHRRAWSAIESDGYRIRGFVRFADVAAFSLVERFAPLRLRVAIVGCVEHINAAIGYEYLSRELLADVDPAMRSMFEWHFAEEIEHKHVSFEVMQRLKCGYALRLASTLLVVPLFYALVSIGTAMLMWQDRSLLKASSLWGWVSHAFGKRGTAWRMALHVVDYLRPGFDPSQRDDAQLAAQALRRWPNARATDATSDSGADTKRIAA